MKDLYYKLIRGVYQHYKGKHYRVIDFAVVSGTEDSQGGPEYMVLYYPMWGGYLLTCRPAREFLEEVEWEGKKVPRFKLVNSTGIGK